MFLLFLFLLSFIFGFVTIYLTYDNEEKTGVIFVQKNDFDLPEQNLK